MVLDAEEEMTGNPDNIGGTPVEPPEDDEPEPPDHPLTAQDAWPLQRKRIA